MKNDNLENIRNVGKLLINAIQEIKNLKDYEFKLKKTRYDSEGNLEFVITANKTGAKSPEAQRYENLKTFETDLPELNSYLLFNGNSYQVVGCNTTGSKIFLMFDGKRYQIPTENVKKKYKNT